MLFIAFVLLLEAPAVLGRFRGRSNSDTRASMSSISMAFFARSSTLSAARTRVDAGALVSSMIFASTEAAAPDICWSRAMDCEKAARPAARYPRQNGLSVA